MNKALAEAVQRGAWDAVPHELKLSLDPKNLSKLLAAVLLTSADAKERAVRIFDTPRRALAKAGVTLRHKEKKKGADLTVKVRPIPAERLTGRWLRSRVLELEADVVGNDRLLSASIGQDLAAPMKTFDPSLLAPLQRAMLEELAQVQLPAELKPTKPAQVWLWRPEGLTIERWKLPGGVEVLELSTTVAGAALDATRQRLEQLLDGAGVRSAKQQRTKSELLLATL